MIKRFVIKDQGNVSVVKEPMRGQETVVRLDDARGDVWRRVDFETNLRLLSVIDGQTLKDEHTQTRSGTTSDGVGHDETLQVIAIFNSLLQSVADGVHDFLSSGVVTTSKVVRSIFFAVDDKILVEKLVSWSFLDFVAHRCFQINEKGFGAPIVQFEILQRKSHMAPRLCRI